MQKVYWDLPSLFLYLFLSFVGYFCLRAIVEKANGKNVLTILTSKQSMCMIIIWTFFATFRLCNGYIGGSDSMGYIDFFEHCNDPGFAETTTDHSVLDPAFFCINKVIRFISSDYHIYFAIIYSFMASSIILFTKKYCAIGYSYVSFVLAFFLYLRSFSSIRSNLGLSFILIALYYLSDKRYKKSYLWAMCAVLTHKIFFLIALVVPFCHIFQKKDLKLVHVILLLVISVGFGIMFQDLFILYTSLNDMGGAYGAYAAKAKESATLWYVPNYEMYALSLLILVFYKRIDRQIDTYKQLKKTEGVFNLKILRLICVFDILTLPVNLLLGNWRAYELLYIPRMCMWCYIVSFLGLKINNKKQINVIFFIVLIAWIILRLYKTYEDTRLMPYAFDLL